MFTKTRTPELIPGENGLVPLTFVATYRDGGTYVPGEHAGFKIEEAERLVRQGYAVPYGQATKEVERARQQAEADRPDPVSIPVFLVRRLPPNNAGESVLLGQKVAAWAINKGIGLPAESEEARTLSARITEYRARLAQIEADHSRLDWPSGEEQRSYYLSLERLVREAQAEFGTHQAFIVVPQVSFEAAL